MMVSSVCYLGAYESPFAIGGIAKGSLHGSFARHFAGCLTKVSTVGRTFP